MNQSILKIKKLSHRYSVQWAVRDIDLEIKANGIYGLLGSNGAGKSTIMNIMCGVLKPTSGTIVINGADMKTDPVKAKLNIGFLPQKPPLYNDLTVEEYLSYCASLRQIPGSEVRAAVERTMEKCGITHFSKRLIRNLSGGYQQRVGIAQAIIHSPSIVVFDEPTNGLDPNQILEIRNLIHDIAKEHTVILSTHILSEVQAICDHIFMIEQGKVVFSGSVDDFNNYITPDTLFVELRNAPSLDELQSVDDVVKVDDLGGNKFRIHFDVTHDLIQRLVRLSVEKNWELNEIRLERSSLDEIFADLSKQSSK